VIGDTQTIHGLLKAGSTIVSSAVGELNVSSKSLTLYVAETLVENVSVTIS
jgi:hypothetical protein